MSFKFPALMFKFLNNLEVLQLQLRVCIYLLPSGYLTRSYPVSGSSVKFPRDCF